jgi:tetratricopeptide (TPR) repeat protein
MRHGSKVRVTASSDRSPDKGRVPFVCLALVLVTCAVYWPVHANDFVNYDDNTYITENEHVLHGLNWPDIKWAFTTAHGGYAHPVTWIAHQLDYQVFGAWAGGHHLMNLAIHVANTLLLFLLFWRLTPHLWPCAFVAILFSIHPLHVESVAWIAERKDVLSGLFFLLTLHAYAAFATTRQVRHYVVALCLFVLGILSKPMLVTVPFVLLLFDYWPLGRMTFHRSERDAASQPGVGRLILEKIPFALVAGAWSILTFLLQKEAGVVGQQELPLRIGNAIVSYATYLWNTFWPLDLAVFYPYPAALRWETVLVAAAFLTLVSVLCIIRRKNSPYLLAGWFWYLGMLAPVIGVIQAGAQAHADRYTYLPQIGIWFGLSWEIAALTKSWSIRRQLLSVTAAIVIALLMVRTWNQTAVWRDSESLWTNALAVSSDSLVVHYNLGHVVGQKGRYDEAIHHFTEALRIQPDYFDALLNLGITLYDQGKAAEAIRYFHQALEVKPDSAKAHMQLALALVKQRKGDEALQEFYKAQELDPNQPLIRVNLGLMLAHAGKLSEAAAQLTEALRLDPNSAEAHNNLGLVFLMTGQPEKSLPHFLTALDLKPSFTVARDNLRRAQKQIDAQQK